MKKNTIFNYLPLVFILSSVLFSQEVITITEPFAASGGVTVDVNGNVYVADFGQSLNGGANGTNVYTVSKSGEVEVFASGFEGASGNAFDSKGNLYQSNIAGNYISKIYPDGTTEVFASETIVSPVGIAIDEDDNVYVANCGNGSISKITPLGAASVFASSFFHLKCPNGLTIDKEGNLYTCNFQNGNVIKIDSDGNVSRLATIPSDRCGHLTYANGVLYVSGRCSQQIYEVTLDGEVSVIAGSGERGNEDGLAMEAKFNHANGIAASPDGDTLYVNMSTSLNGDCVSSPLNPSVVRMITGVKQTTSVENDELTVGFNLEQNYPNPFNPSTTINYSLSQAGEVTLKVFDISGKEVATLVDGKKGTGSHNIVWNGKDKNGNELATGIYIYTLRSAANRISKKMMLLK